MNITVDFFAGFETRGIDSFRNNVKSLEDQLFKSPNIVDLDVFHHFSDGVYVRELHIPADVTLTGKIHKTEHLSILAKGKITVATEEGKQTLEAPYVLVSPVNTKRAAYAHTDCVWITIHGTHETDVEKLEDELTTTEYLSIEDKVDS